MKKSRFLALVLVASLSLVGAGYAYWTDALFVNSTVKTGTFDVEFTKVKTEIVEHGDNKKAENYTNKDNPTIAKITNPNTATITIENLYPGKEVNYDIYVKNTGSIPVVFDYADVEFKGDTDHLKKVLQAKCGLSFGEPSKFQDMDSLEKQINDLLNGLKIDPTDPEKEIKGAFILPTSVENSDLAEGRTLVVEITINWKQHNK
jgi:archaellum component FlaG (FlaF/FlaG flagellin family)